jgi:hypothetical protein
MNRHRTAFLAAAVAGLVLALPALAAYPLKPGYSDFGMSFGGTGNQLERLKPGYSDFGLPYEYKAPSAAPTASQARPTTRISSQRKFDWGAAGVGAGIAGALVALVAALFVFGASRREGTREALSLNRAGSDL